MKFRFHFTTISFFLYALSVGVAQEKGGAYTWELQVETILFNTDSNTLGYSIRLPMDIGFFVTDSLQLDVFDIDSGSLRYRIGFNLPDDVSVKPQEWRHLIWADEQYFLPLWFSNKLMVFDKKGQYVDALPLEIREGKNHYHSVNYRLAAFSDVFNPYRNSVFLSVLPSWKGFNKKNKFYEGGINHYEARGLVAEIDLKGKLLNLYGAFDKVYKNMHFLNYLDACAFDFYKNDGILYTCQISDAIHIEYFDERPGVVFGQRGKYINKSIEELPLVKSLDDFKYFGTSFIIESPFNWGVYAGERFVARLYSTEMTDTITLSTQEKEYIDALQNGDIKGCALMPASELRRWKLVNQKHFYIQIYDTENNYQLVLDQPIDLRYPKYLGYNNGKFYFQKAGPPLQILSISLVSTDDSSKMD